MILAGGIGCVFIGIFLSYFSDQTMNWTLICVCTYSDFCKNTLAKHN
ncbi:hypothetical protein Desor_0538 [Desulfosporosinus orientis DSM 765]|uniref:Uncharacterized protein n=1 Tax=Desulfosporosinus orientis (strain ATCC 19365 / DSM 765 / NCIMB 8382 / VKM B-1628 / Singapore I) TaxID=768706 RepID=G7WAA2_DESOD|nr:hypothetical protein Desor_0538 [Desulfosporosinus orientis DSM 765]